MHKYDGTNWSVWQEDITEVLSHHGGLYLIVNRSPRPESASKDNSTEIPEWYYKKRLAIHAIRMTISTSVLPVIFFPNEQTALELWNRLKDFPTTREFQKAIVFQRWSTLMLGKSMSVVEYGRIYKHLVYNVLLDNGKWPKG